MKIGFTGTQKGMTSAQKLAFGWQLVELKPSEFHHGDCIGADEQAHEMVAMWNEVCHPSARIWTVGHIPLNESKRAYCHVDERREPYDYLERNLHIVNETELLIATPADFIELQRSGTWSTVRKARDQHKRVYIIRPDGSILEENVG